MESIECCETDPIPDDQVLALLFCDPSEEGSSERDAYLRALTERIKSSENLVLDEIDQPTTFLPGAKDWYKVAAREEIALDVGALLEIRRKQHQAAKYANNVQYRGQYEELERYVGLVDSAEGKNALRNDAIHAALEAAFSNVVPYGIVYPLMIKLFGADAAKAIAAFEGVTLATPFVPGGPGVYRFFSYVIGHGIWSGEKSFRTKVKSGATASRAKEWAKSVVIGFPVATDAGYVYIPFINKMRRSGLHRGMARMIVRARTVHKLGEKYGFTLSDWKNR